MAIIGDYTDSCCMGTENRDKFYMCRVEGSYGCKYIHNNGISAKVEAERLAKLPDNQGRKVYIMESSQYCVVEPLPVKWGECI